MSRLRGLDLFSGIGGISLALSPWVETIAYCECEPYAQAVLLERMQTGDLDNAPIWDDVRTLNRAVLDTEIDVIFGGFPCQDISVAGLGRGLEGERSGLFFEILRLAEEFQPAFIFLENVPAIAGRGLNTVVEEIAALGYDSRWGVLSAADVGAPHKRDRWFLLAYSMRSGLEGLREPRRESETHSDFSGTRGWTGEPNLDRVAHGVPYRVDRIKALGNSVVPQAAREAFIRLVGLK